MTPTIIVVTGAESTGKSTLAAALARALDAPLVPEFARTYAERAQRPLTAADVEPIARGQRAAEDAAIARARRSGQLVLDTDLLSTLVYARHYYRDAMPELDELVRARRPALYLLCDIDIPWVPDPVRDSTTARPSQHADFLRYIAAGGTPVTIVSGGRAERLDLALHAVRAAAQAGD